MTGRTADFVSIAADAAEHVHHLSDSVVRLQNNELSGN